MGLTKISMALVVAGLKPTTTIIVDKATNTTMYGRGSRALDALQRTTMPADSRRLKAFLNSSFPTTDKFAIVNQKVLRKEMINCKRRQILVLMLLLTLLAQCGTERAAEQSSSINVAVGYRATVAVQGLEGPTQMILAPDGVLLVAQLAGSENGATGQVLAVNLANGERRVVLDKLNKPTGIALLGDGLWIAAGRELLRVPLNNGVAGASQAVLQNLPFNGRSNGTLTTTPNGKLLYETSGSREGNNAATGSATLWELDPANPTEPRAIATGLKGAYGHTFDAKGQLWTTEIGDDPVNGGAPPDELNLVIDGGNYGWPQCFGQQQAAQNYGGTTQYCRTTRLPVALFAPNSTPTSVVESPWQAGKLLVALWASADGSVVQVAPSAEGAPAEVQPFLSGLQHPQHLLALADDSLLVSDFGAGVIYRVTRD